jgi:hypothetical protein
MRFHLLPAILAEHLFLAIQFIERIWFEHDTFAFAAMLKAKEVPDFMCTFFCYPVNKVIIAPFPPVILIIQPGCRDYRCTDRLAGKPEHKTVPVIKKVLVNHKEKRFFQRVTVHVRLDAV